MLCLAKMLKFTNVGEMRRIDLLFIVMLVQNLPATQQNQDITQGNHAIKRTDNGLFYANFKVHKFHYLQLSSRAFSHEVLQADECAFSCVSQQTCYSLNIGLSPNQNGKFLCELLSGDMYRSPKNLTSSQQFDHYSIESPCSNDPCKNNRTCIPNYKENTYSCICTPGYRGRYCSKVCSAPLGMEDYRITSAQISASSQYDGNHAPNQGRLHFKEISGSHAGSWVAGRNNVNQWFQVDLTIETTVTFLATQGRNMYEQWVTKYKLQYSNNGSTFQVFKQDGESSDKVFVGNSDRDTVVKNPVISPIKARYLRLIPTEWHNHISKRIELYGCLENMRALGMESGTITDSQLTASSIWNVYHSPARARLHTKDLGLSKGIGAWSSLTNDLNQWLQVDLRKITSVTYIATQGRNSYSISQWVKKYKLQFSNDGVSFLFYQRQGDSSDVVFEGNIDRDTVVYHLLDPPITARFLRVKPTEWQSHISMRLELYTSPEET
ncbi:EGF-like repeat and discoidin I-like domain-containing protein 3 [Stylophora pistillata]|uniref:EGF-like repeat and discoidin I-like domain-containing protein 3 n=1 Tax=Stylophora pistillata TaxID=50429 RepID=A0A2B4RTV3_STYPI|nr:EGF-like repeat and discoidin I-like domain-containing protein 3 [Stylophora pistillata]